MGQRLADRFALLGRDSLEPFVEVCDARDAGIFVLVKTSNPGGGLLQDRTTEGQTVYAAVADLIAELNSTRKGQSGYGPVGAVVGSHLPRTALRDAGGDADKLDPDSWLRGSRGFGR